VATLDGMVLTGSASSRFLTGTIFSDSNTEINIEDLKKFVKAVEKAEKE
jgi:hypothetical protein